MFRLRDWRQLGSENKKLKVASPYEQIKEYINQKINSGSSTINLEIEDHGQNLRLSEIPLELLRSSPNPFVTLNISLQGFYTDQEDFNSFCMKFVSLRPFNSLSLRFYNKRVEYLDSLFLIIKRIPNVSLNLSNFKKIRFESDLKDLHPNIQSLDINLKNTTFKTMEDKNSFENFLISLKDLKTFKISLKSTDQLKLLLALPKQTQIYLKLNSRDIDLTFCDLLLSLKEEYDLQIAEVESNFNLLNVYLSSNGLNVEKPFLEKIEYKVDDFTDQDLQLIKKVPQFLHEIKKKERLVLDGIVDRGGKEVISKRNLKIIERIIIPVIHRISCISFNSYVYFKNMRYEKQQGVWQIQFCVFECNDEIFEMIFPHLTRIRLLDRWTSDYPPQIDTIMKRLCQSNYLIQINFNQQFLQTDSLALKFKVSLLEEFVQILQGQCLDKLKFFVFFKNLVYLIPIPQQIFYDLLDQ